MQTILAIACGGALGSVLRHFLNNYFASVTGSNFPWGILIINVVGSFLMGVLITVFANIGTPSQSLRAFLVVGVLGGFTTFSTFSLDAVLLAERGAMGQAAFYVVGSVGISLIALCVGMIGTRYILP